MRNHRNIIEIRTSQEHHKSEIHSNIIDMRNNSKFTKIGNSQMYQKFRNWNNHLLRCRRSRGCELWSYSRVSMKHSRLSSRFLAKRSSWHEDRRWGGRASTGGETEGHPQAAGNSVFGVFVIFLRGEFWEKDKEKRFWEKDKRCLDFLEKEKKIRNWLFETFPKNHFALCKDTSNTPSSRRRSRIGLLTS